VTGSQPGATFGNRDEIAIIGMTGRFPGAGTIREFWENLQNGVESIHILTPEELRAGGVSEAEINDPEYVPVTAALADGDCFDAAFFGCTKRDAEIMDPQHRIFLECAWAALEDAGYDPETYEGAIGVFGGVAPNTYLPNVLMTRPDIMDLVGGYPILIGSEREYAITRVAYKLNLRGPAVSIATACSTSGVALHLAYQSVLSGETDMALVGGGRVRAPFNVGYRYEPDGILSPDGHCRAFDANAAGTIRGSGMAMIVIKRLSDAIRDGDTVRALVKGTAINNDGSVKIGYTAPGMEGQEAVIAEALEMAEVDPATITYVEAHGTGTFLGDPIEVGALTGAYRRYTDRTQYCAIGSVKSNIGHLDTGAGTVGIIKTVLAMQHGQIPPTVGFSQPNPQIDFQNSPFFVNDTLRDWIVDDGPRRAGVSAFGLGGTNAHIVLEEAPPIVRSASDRRWHLILLSARTPAALEQSTAN
jgi:acyl transferase domain-containing protein